MNSAIDLIDVSPQFIIEISLVHKVRTSLILCHHFDLIRYVVSGASHPVISATVARPPRDW